MSSYMKYLNLDFLFSIAPITLGHLLFPPIAYFYGQRLTGPLGDLMAALYFPQLNFQFIYDLTLQDNHKIIDLQRITHIFIH